MKRSIFNAKNDRYISVISRGGYKKEAAIRIICVIIFLTVLSVSYIMELLYALSVYLRPPASLHVGQILELVLYATLGSLMVFALASFLLGPRMILLNRELTPVGSNTYLAGIVRSCSQFAGLNTVPMAFLDEKPGSSALVVGYTAKRAKIIVNKDFMAALDQEEFRAVIFHELGHIKNGDMTLMTWAAAFQKSLKYWLTSYFIILFGGTSLIYRSPKRMVAWFLFSGGAPTAESSLSIMALVFYLFVTAAVNSASRVRELTADDFAGSHVHPSTLISSIRSSMLYVLTSNILDGKAKILKKAIRFRKLSAITHYMYANHPNTRERIAKLKEKEAKFERLSFPTLETAAYAGAIAALLLMGVKALIWGTPPGYESEWVLFNRWEALLGNNLVFMWLVPSWIVFVTLNISFVWHYGSEKFFEKREGRTKQRKGIDRLMAANILVASSLYFAISVVYHGISVIGDCFLGRPVDLILRDQSEWLMIDVFTTVIASCLCFLFFYIFLTILPKKERDV